MRWMVPYVNQRRNGVALSYFSGQPFRFQIAQAARISQLPVCGKPTETLELASCSTSVADKKASAQQLIGIVTYCRDFQGASSPHL
jgi:hypothetical protein